MKKYLLFLFVLALNVAKGQTYYPCSVLPPEFSSWCYQVAYLDTLNLEEDSSLIVLDTSNNCNTWQLGHSYKPVFDSVNSPFGIVTDTLNSYGNNLNCSFILKIPTDHFYGTTLLFFEHKYETDSLLDGGYIQYSCDQGQNWRLLTTNGWQQNGSPILVNFFHYLDEPMPVIHDSIPAFSGTNGDWQWSGIQFVWYIPVKRANENRWLGCSDFGWDSIYFRFTFDSDSINNNKAGWMIRNIVYGSNDLVGAVAENHTQALKIFPNPTTDKISVELPTGIGKLKNIRLMDITGRVISFLPEAAKNSSGSSKFVVDVSSLPSGIYSISAETEKFVFRQKLVKE